jgi:hypothetical protein
MTTTSTRSNNFLSKQMTESDHSFGLTCQKQEGLETRSFYSPNQKSGNRQKGFWAGLGVFLTGLAVIWLVVSLIESFFTWSTKSKCRGAVFLFVMAYPFAYILASLVVTYSIQIFGKNTYSDGELLLIAIIAGIASAVFASRDGAKNGQLSTTQPDSTTHQDGESRTFIAMASHEWSETPPFVAFFSVTFIVAALLVLIALMAIYFPDF